MSKRNMLLGYASGKVGDLIFYRAGGEQRARGYNPKPRNAKSELQTIQRVQLSNLVSFFRSCVALLNHSFTNRPTNQSSYNAFVAANLNKVRVYLGKSAASYRGCVAAPYRISDGTLPAIEVSGAGDNSVTNISLGSLTISDSTTVGMLSAALIANNINIRQGMQLSYISVVQGTNVATGNPKVTSGFYELTINSADETLLKDVMPAQAIKNVNGYLGHGSHVADGGFAWILSARGANGELQVSTQSLILNNTATYDAYRTTQARRDACESYGAQPEPFLVPVHGDDIISPISNNPSVASVAIGSRVLTGNDLAGFPVAAGTNTLTIHGGNLGEVTDIKVGPGTPTIAATISSQSDTEIVVTFSALDATTWNDFVVAIDGATLYTWHKVNLQPVGGDDDGDIG